MNDEISIWAGWYLRRDIVFSTALTIVLTQKVTQQQSLLWYACSTNCGNEDTDDWYERFATKYRMPGKFFRGHAQFQSLARI